jgi:hypothetical protein
VVGSTYAYVVTNGPERFLVVKSDPGRSHVEIELTREEAIALRDDLTGQLAGTAAAAKKNAHERATQWKGKEG